MKKKSGLKTFLIILLFLIVTPLMLYLNLFLGSIVLALFLVYMYRLTKSGICTTIGSVKYGKGNLEAALTWYGRALKSKRVKPGTVISYSYLLLKSGKIDQAEKTLKSLDTTKIGNFEKILHASNTALVMWKQDNLDGAIEFLEGFSNNIKNTTILGSLGYFLILKGDLDKALAYNLNAYEYNNTDHVIMDNLAQNYYLMGEYEKSAELYEKLMNSKIKPTFPAAYFNYSLVLMELGNNEKALEYLKTTSEFKLNILSSVTSEQIEEKIKEAEEKLQLTEDN